MNTVHFNFNIKDIFRAPRLALSGKKIFIFIQGNLAGFISYWLFSILAFYSNGNNIKDIISKYGLYPCLFGHDAEWYAWFFYYIGIIIWTLAILLSCTAVSRITLKQLKGNEFYSSKDSWSFVFKHWRTVALTPLSIILIILFFLILAFICSLIGRIAFLGEIFFSFFYIIYFFGATFIILTSFVFFCSLIYTPSIVGMYEEDTLGSMFHSYSITFGQGWRIILYNLLLFSLVIIGLEIFSWLFLNSIGLTNYIFGHEWLMSEKSNILNNHALTHVFPIWLYENLLFIKHYILGYLNLESGIPYLFSIKINYYNLPTISILEIITSVILSLSYFIIALSILSYGLSIIAVGESLMFIIFKKLSDDDNLILRKDSDEVKESENELNINNDNSNIYSTFSNSSNEEE
ncbi:MAG: hypothetical protein CMG55_03210 [Candidatus Marinimicrobia bacterium]|nr:hypothetical protein [Candidatus Neomarinimicrobiota bacterium]|tara:strand:+ start:468 stop:1682 length:1215 start_codon:yes stop_codon:yes gene_type:complete